MVKIFSGKFEIVSTIEKTEFPITLDDFKNFGSIRWQGDDEEDANFTNILNSAILTFEKATGRTIIKRQYDCLLCGFHNLIYERQDPKSYPFTQSIAIEKGDITQINSIEYQVDNIYNILDQVKYRVYKDTCCATIKYAKSNNDFPTNYDVNENGSSIIGAVKVNFDAGYEKTDNKLPDDIKFCILTIASHHYNSDLSCTDQFDYKNILPNSIMNLVNNFVCYKI